MAKAAGNTPSPKTRAQVLHTLGFGVPATSDPHHFKITIPKASTGKVQISEHLGLQAASNDNAVIDRVLLDRPRWTAIRAEVQRAFNARLAAHGIKAVAWKVGDNPVDRLLGKELCVLAWAVEQMEMEKIPVAVRNWLALRPEERWWLFGMTAMSTGFEVARAAARFPDRGDDGVGAGEHVGLAILAGGPALALEPVQAELGVVVEVVLGEEAVDELQRGTHAHRAHTGLR